MPYPNEHSARLQDPGKFDPKTYRRTAGGKLYGSINVPKTIGMIWGKLKGKTKPADPVIAQALRFSISNWTAEKARHWLKTNKVKYIRFEPAAKSEQSSKEGTYHCECIKCGYALQSDQHCSELKCPKCGGQMRRKERPGPGKNKEIQTMSPQELKELGVDPFIFNQPGIVEFAEDGETKSKVRLNLYDGAVVQHWYWGNLAFELSSMRMAKRRNPILFNHDVNQRIAYSTTATFEKHFSMEGTFLKTSEIARQVKGQMDEGFPFEASLRFDPNKSKIEHIKDGETTEVNGHKLKGPGTIVRDALILEGSICVFGALENTASEAFEIAQYILAKENTQMADEHTIPMTVEELTEENFSQILPEIHQKVFEKGKAEGEKAERDLFAELQKACGDDPALLVQCYGDGKTPDEALKLRLEKAEQDNKDLAEKLAAQQKEKIDPAKQEFSDTASPPGASEKFDEKTATAEQLKDHYNKTQALQDEFHNFEAYQAYIEHDVKNQ